MIKAILSGAKSQTRRIVKHQGGIPSGAFWDHGAYMPFEWIAGEWSFRDRTNKMHGARASGAPEFKCPYGTAGDRLWARETFSHHVGADALKEPAYCDYRADQLPDDAAICWTPSIFMPRWASRITLEITEVRVERLNEISEEDAIAEGAHRKIWITSPMSAGAMNARGDYGTHRDGYKEIWEDINGVGSWALSPWVWAISFRRL